MLKQVLAFAVLTLSLSTQAALIDMGDVTRDTDTGLDWLDLSSTGGLDINTALSLNEGWRLASKDEVENLFWKLFPEYYVNTGVNNFYSSYNDTLDSRRSDLIDNANTFRDLFGITTTSSSFNRTYSYGIYYDEFNSPVMTGALTEIDSAYTFIYGPGFQSEFNWDPYVTGHSNYGVFLVQVSEVPIPSAIWLFGSALIGLAGFKRKV